MNREQKVAEVESLKEKFAKSQLTVLANYKGLDVAAVTELRKKLFEKESQFKVVKNRLAKIAIKDTPFEALEEYFSETTAVTTVAEDVTGSAKVLTDFAKGNESLQIKAGFLDGKVIDAKEIKALASMPTKEELIAKLLGSMQAPATNLVSVLSQIPRQLVQVLAAVQDQKEKNG